MSLGGESLAGDRGQVADSFLTMVRIFDRNRRLTMWRREKPRNRKGKSKVHQKTTMIVNQQIILRDRSAGVPVQTGLKAGRKAGDKQMEAPVTVAKQ